MVVFALWPWVAPVWNGLVLFASVVLIFLVLIQRGKGGGLAGAFGGAGGSSAFGSRAGDTFTRITISVAAVWVVMLMLQIWIVRSTDDTGRPTTGSIDVESSK